MNCKKKDCFNCPYPDCINDYVKKEYDRPAAYIKKQVERQSERIQQRAEAGLCTTCGKRPPRNGYRTCAECQARSRRYANRHNRSIGRVPESLLDGVSLCKRCGKAPPASGYKLCDRCLESARRALDHTPSHSGIVVDNNFTRALRADAERMKAKT